MKNDAFLLKHVEFIIQFIIKSQSSPSSSLSSPDHPPGGGGGGDQIAPLLAMLAQIRAVRAQTLAQVEQLAPHMPGVVDLGKSTRNPHHNEISGDESERLLVFFQNFVSKLMNFFI